MDNTGLQNNTPLPQTDTPSPQPGDQLVNQPAATSPWQTAATPITPPITASPWQASLTQTTPSVQPNIASPSPWQTAATVQPTIEQVPPVVTPLAAEPIMPSKKKVSPMILGGLAMFFIVAVAGGTFMISRGINTASPVAPNAPASEPAAFDPNEGVEETVTTEETMMVDTTDIEPFDPNGTIDCTEIPDTAPYGNRCLPVVMDEEGNTVWAAGAVESVEQ